MLFDKLDVVTVFKIIVYPQQDVAVKWLRASLEDQFSGQITTSFAVNGKGQSVLSGRITQDDPDEIEFMHTRNALYRLLGEATERVDAEAGQARIDFELAPHDDVVEPLTPSEGAEPVPSPLVIETAEPQPDLDAETMADDPMIPDEVDVLADDTSTPEARVVRAAALKADGVSEELELHTPLRDDPVGRRVKGGKTERTPEWAR